MYAALVSAEFNSKNTKLNERVKRLKEKIKESKYKIDDKFTKLGDTHYYNNCLPLISKARDVLKKPNGICKIRVNWKKKKFEGLSVSEINDQLKEQWGWNLVIVDAEHTRNKFKNKSVAWVVFDTEEQALDSMNFFNAFFTTAIELDAIEEYKRFKENPEKRPLTFDKLVDNAYDLYEAVDQGEI